MARAPRERDPFPLTRAYGHGSGRLGWTACPTCSTPTGQFVLDRLPRALLPAAHLGSHGVLSLDGHGLDQPGRSRRVVVGWPCAGCAWDARDKDRRGNSQTPGGDRARMAQQALLHDCEEGIFLHCMGFLEHLSESWRPTSTEVRVILKLRDDQPIPRPTRCLDPYLKVRLRDPGAT